MLRALLLATNGRQGRVDVDVDVIAAAAGEHVEETARHRLAAEGRLGAERAQGVAPRVLVAHVTRLEALPFPFVRPVEQLVAPVEDGEIIDRVVGVRRAALDAVTGRGRAREPLVALGDGDHVGLESERRTTSGRARYAHKGVPREHDARRDGGRGGLIHHGGLGEPLAGGAQDVAVDQVEVHRAGAVRDLVERRRPPAGEVVARGIAAGAVRVDGALLQAGSQGAAGKDRQTHGGIDAAVDRKSVV